MSDEQYWQPDSGAEPSPDDVLGDTSDDQADEAALVVEPFYEEAPSIEPEPPFSDRAQEAVTTFRISWRDVLTVALLAVILVAGYWMRSVGRNWDDYTHLHPDERFLTDVASTLRSGRSLRPVTRTWASQDQQIEDCLNEYPGPSLEELGQMTPEERLEAEARIGKGGYFDARCSDLNPNNTNDAKYVYGQFPLLSVRMLAEVYQRLSDEPTWTTYTSIQLIGRTMSSVFDSLVILLVFLIGTRLFGRWHGLLAAALYAFAAFPIQQSHFWTADAFTAFWVVLAIYFAVRVMDQANQYPDRFVALPWIVAAVVVWLWEIEMAGVVYIETIAVYLAVFSVVGLITTLAVEQRRMPVALIASGLGVGFMAILAVVDIVSGEGLLAASSALIILTALWLFEWNRYAGFAGLFPWLAGAFGLWIYDGLAHYDELPTVRPLIVYLLLFLGTGMLVSVLRYANLREKKPAALVSLGTPLVLLWLAIILGVAVGVSIWGMLAALVLAAFIGMATAFGLQDEVGFGLAFGGAVAGRVNVLPLVGVLFLAMLIRLLALLDWRIPRFERNHHLTRMIVGVVLAGFATFLAFRFMQPHAFVGPSVLGIEINKGWTSDIADAQYLVSGDADIPPNWQWASRVKWLFPGQNIALYGLGLPLGVAAWGGFLWAMLTIARGKRHWTRLAIPAAWVLVYFGWLGQNWVTTMRYFMPIYGMLAVMAAWLLVEGLVWTYRLWRALPQATSRRLAVGTAGLIFAFVLGHTLLYGYGFTSIHRTQLTRVAASRYMQDQVPGDVGIYIEMASGDTRLVNVMVLPRGITPDIARLDDGAVERMQLSPARSINLDSVVLHQIGDPEQDDGVERVRLRVLAVNPAGDEILLGDQTLDVDLSNAASDFGGEYVVAFDPPIPLYMDAEPGFQNSFWLELEVLEGGPVTMSRLVEDPRAPLHLAHMTVDYRDSEFDTSSATQEINLERVSGYDQVTYFNANSFSDYEFTANATGFVQRIVIPHVSDPLGDANIETMRVALLDNRYEDSTGFRVEGETSADFRTYDDGQLLFGPAAFIELADPFPVEAGRRYTLTIAPDDLLGVAGTAVAWEGQWDDPMPTAVCPVPDNMVYDEDLPSGLCDVNSLAVNMYGGFYIGLTQNMFWPDEPAKRDDTLDILNQTDYLLIGSNRFYDSFNRIPTRWPMSNRYYDALFSGELGFELVEVFTSYAQIGPFEWPDQVLPSDDLPDWRNEFEAEEAFHVYDHPAVFIFRKTEDYSPELAAEILDVNITSFDHVGDPYAILEAEVGNKLNWGAKPATESPTALQFSEEQAEIQQGGGTWSELFNRDAFYNRNQVAGVIIWWALMMLVGWLTFPLLTFILPGLPDRGFAVSKLVGWLLIAWVAWFASSFNVRLWSQAGLFGLLVVLGGLNALLAYYRREQLITFLRRRWRHLLFVEILTGVLFLFFIGVRLGTPDLWHSPFGGEKPMNFAYFNGVLRSTIFPPIDPWFSGGYINYYYWGYVLVGAPTKMLGIMPAFAYNLILPTLFAMTGMGAFSVAYNLVAWSRERRQEKRLQSDQPDKRHREHPGPAANPYLAGIAALVLAVLLGNLDTIRVFSTGVAQAGDWYGAEAAVQDSVNLSIFEFQEANGRPPSTEELAIIREEATMTRLEEMNTWFDALFTGFERIISGERTLNVPSNRWYWGPTRVIAELSDRRGHNAITEMPYFTFLYGDMHAHMMAMPLALLATLIFTAEILGAGRGLRGALAAFLALALGGITVGLLRPTNTWDWPVYLALGGVGLTFAAWVRQGRLRGHEPPQPLYLRLRRFLDLRYVLQLWPLLLALPMGMLMRGGLLFYEISDYNQRQDAGQIPAYCEEYNPLEIDEALIPPSCEGNLKPVLDPANFIKAGLGALIVVGLLYVAGLVLLGNRFDRDALLVWIARVGGFLAISFFAILPFSRSFATAFGKILPWELDKTPLWAYLDIHGIFLFILISMLLWQTIRWLRAHRVAELGGLGVPVLAVVLLVPMTLLASLYLGLGEYRIFLVTLPMMAWLSVLFLLPDQSQVERWIYVLAGLALGLSMTVEVVVLEGDIGRQNTVFKFYIQVWLLFSIVGGVSLAWLVRSIERWHVAMGGLWQMALAAMLSLALLYPFTATQGRFVDRFNKAETPLTLDGLEYMKYAPYGEDPDGIGSKPGVWFNLSGDYYMIRWLQDNVEGTPTIIEGQHTEYSWGARIAINTGLPTVLGWRHHQSQQRNLINFDRMLYNRLNNVRAFYTLPDIDVAWNMIEEYDIEFIVVGTFERIIYEDIKEADPAIEDSSFRIGQSPGLAKFDEMVMMGLLVEAYRAEVCVHANIRTVDDCPPERISTDVIYQVVPDVEYEAGTSMAQATE